MAADKKQVGLAISTALLSMLPVLLQLNSILLLWKMHNNKIQSLIMNHPSRKKNLRLQKLKFIKQRILRRKKRSCWFKPGRTDLWWENILTGVAPEEAWKKNFRMTRNSFEKLVTKLSPYISPNLLSPNNRIISVQKKLAIALYFLKDTGSLGMTANAFGIAINTTSGIVTEVCDALTKTWS